MICRKRKSHIVLAGKVAARLSAVTVRRTVRALVDAGNWVNRSHFLSMIYQR